MRLVPGTVLFFDNWRTLHGRHSFNGHRHMCGAYVNMEDFQSKLRYCVRGRRPPSANSPSVIQLQEIGLAASR